ncbi:beta-phosphoglucomutase [Candidatus Enterococcus ferrettii]|uniref:Beta-phosphoglucomutase n=1 Tax=Candidatus Enterococcus ferrettii TaxID=2815324 RepID=A0ABV0EL54_9ENTE|nr:beta-phosphoglucomutase [Enterococcus sp. 665A]MBO1340478.1 beta-phosphoglucomutase [Enterococcus sp. 665A]
MINGFIFDLDGVLADTAPLHFMAWQKLAAELNISIDLTFNERLKGISRRDSLELILDHGGQAAHFTEEEKQQLADRKNRHYCQLLEQLTAEDLLPGVHPFLQAAKEKEILCAVASASHNAPHILKQLMVTDFFAAVVDPASLSKGKPDPEIFLKAAAALNLGVQEVVGFEDAQAGIEGLRTAGIFAVGIDPKGQLKKADLLVPSFTELSPDLFNKYKKT